MEHPLGGVQEECVQLLGGAPELGLGGLGDDHEPVLVDVPSGEPVAAHHGDVGGLVRVGDVEPRAGDGAIGRDPGRSDREQPGVGPGLDLGVAVVVVRGVDRDSTRGEAQDAAEGGGSVVEVVHRRGPPRGRAGEDNAGSARLLSSAGRKPEPDPCPHRTDSDSGSGRADSVAEIRFRTRTRTRTRAVRERDRVGTPEPAERLLAATGTATVTVTVTASVTATVPAVTRRAGSGSRWRRRKSRGAARRQGRPGRRSGRCRVR